MANYTALDAPSTISALGVSALLRQAWRKKIEFMMVKDDVMVPSVGSGLVGSVTLGKDNDGNVSAIPNKIFHDFSPDLGDEGQYVNQLNMTMSLPLSGAGRYGVDDALGTEEEPTHRQAVLKSNDVGKAVNLQEYGVTYRQKGGLRIAESVQSLLATWRGEDTGYSMRYALVNRYSPNLLVAPHSLTAVLNPNNYVLSSAAQPVYDATGATHEAAVRAALDAVTESNANLTISRLLDLKKWARANYLNPIKYKGKNLLVLYVHPGQAKYLEDPTITGSWGMYIKDVGAFGKEDFSSVVPEAKFIVGDSILIVEDERCPTAGMPDGGASLTQYYMTHGRTDTRATALDADKPWAMNLLCGENALAKLNSQQWKFNMEKQNYDKYKGIDFNAAESWQIPLYDLDTPTDVSLVSEGSAIVWSQYTA